MGVLSSLQEEDGGNVSGSLVARKCDTARQNSHGESLTDGCEEHKWTTTDAVNQGDGDEHGDPVGESIEPRDKEAGVACHANGVLKDHGTTATVSMDADPSRKKNIERGRTLTHNM